MAVRMGRKWQPNGSCCATSQVHAIAVCIAPLSRATDAVRNECVHGGRLEQVHVGSVGREVNEWRVEQKKQRHHEYHMDESTEVSMYAWLTGSLSLTCTCQGIWAMHRCVFACTVAQNSAMDACYGFLQRGLDKYRWR